MGRLKTSAGRRAAQRRLVHLDRRQHGVAPARANPTPKSDTLAHPPRQQHQLAQAQPPGQPPVQGGQQGRAAENGRHQNQFGAWPKRPAGFVPQRIRDYGAVWWRKGQVTRAFDALPQRVQKMLGDNKVEVSIDKDDTALRKNNPDMAKDPAGAYDAGTARVTPVACFMPGPR
jgi:hypothetical protein